LTRRPYNTGHTTVWPCDVEWCSNDCRNVHACF